MVAGKLRFHAGLSQCTLKKIKGNLLGRWNESRHWKFDFPSAVTSKEVKA
jgi:hypothetical protein